MFDHDPTIPFWQRVKRKLQYGYQIMRYASVDPIYAYTSMTDFGWGLSILCGKPYQPHVPEFAFMNTILFGAILTSVGLIGIWNFFNRRNWVLVAHSAFNALFYFYITAIFIEIGDGAAVRNGTMTACIAWIIWRTQMNGWRRMMPDRFVPRGH